MTRAPASDDEPQARDLRLDAICAAAKRLNIDVPADRDAYLRRYYAQADDDELAGEPATLAAAALAHLKWAGTRAPSAALVRVFNATRVRDGWTSPHTIVETVNDDMPFLVDSLEMALTRLGHPIHVTIHPVLRVARSARGEITSVETDGNDRVESFIHFEVVRETDAALLGATEAALAATLRDVRAAVEDWKKMLEKLRAAAADLRATPGLEEDVKAESGSFLEWVARDHFTLLGYREYELTAGEAYDTLAPLPKTGLGLLRPERGEFVVRLTGNARAEARSLTPLVITKSNERSTVHRPAMLDHIGIKVFDGSGRPCLERRFLGLFTSGAYYQSPRTIPLLRMKIAKVLRESGLDVRGHRGKSLQHILDTLPRDDLFQASLDELRAISFGVLSLEQRHKVKLFCRRETFGRYYSCLVYLPRDQYNSRAQRAIENVLLAGLHGSSVESELQISESALARLAVTVRTTAAEQHEPDVAALERQLAGTVRTWEDRVREALLAEVQEEPALDLLHRYAGHFSAAYQEDCDGARAAHDVRQLALLEQSGADLEITLARTAEPTRLRLTTFKRGEPIQLYVALPILEHMGLRVLSERVYSLRETEPLWIQDFELETPAKTPLDPESLGERFKECFAAVLRGDAENDGFNGFVLSASFDWREAELLRAFCKYVLQTRLGYSQAYMHSVLARYPAYCRALIDKFEASFDVDRDAAERAKGLAASEAGLKRELDRAQSLDDDRILRTYGALVGALLRTNYYQRAASGGPKTYVSFKLDPHALPDLPRPKPKFEIFVYSQRVEGVHLRASKVARGGIRWSDRREDFRTEVLGLMKAQQVKNTVIVPNGAKGGFVCKALPSGDRDAVQGEVVECYKTFIRGLLDVTDNIVDGRVVQPTRVLRKDDDDPYLVVAADKGTATFSDLANSLSAEYAFWLGDAFASGGSAGYDHKKLAITARGAWEAVKRHFRELGVDPEKQAFTAIGIGDMSGDVCGNGLLLSPHMKVVAAFDHRHIFLDPSPDPAKGIAERRRLFALPRSSWDDYDRAALSEGGGVYSRQTKSIELHANAQALLDLPNATVTPLELISAVLRARVDLIWNGGIGTYVKASTESQLDAGDPGNDAVRVNGGELRCRVFAEGGNLGVTQRGRIEYASRGGKINTDFIDNSGGVDTSDREVNIKILLGDAIRRKKLARSARDALLAEMKDQIAALVLADNYAQTQALSMMDSRAAERLGEHARLIRVLEQQGLLDRALEFLPTDEQIEERRATGRGLTRPELAVILSYSKIELHGSLVQTDIPDDPFVATELELYFPRQLVERFKGEIQAHRLRRDIIAMLIGGSMINRMGPFFVLRAEEETGASVAQVARAYAIVREVFGVRRLWREIEALDHKVAAKVQYDAIFQISRMVRRAVYWLLQNYSQQLEIEPVVSRFRQGVVDAFAALPTIVAGRSEQRYAGDTLELEGFGLPRPIAQRISALSLATQAFDCIELAREFRLSVAEIGRLHFALAQELHLDVVREQIEALKVDGRWRAMARATLRETLAQEQRALLRGVLGARGGSSASASLAEWLEKHRAEIARVRRGLDDMQMTGPMDFATLSVALKEVGRLV